MREIFNGLIYKQGSMNSSTIAAISTPQGSGGIGIIRISGNNAIQITEKLFRRSKTKMSRNGPECCNQLLSHRVYHGYIVDPDTKKNIDEALVIVMKSPKSYTREDVAEIQSHGGYLVLRQIFEKVLAAGTRIAEPGEFTRRAFLNGRIDLTQAEAVSDLINAKTDTALRLAARQMDGRLRERMTQIGQALNDVRVNLEAAIDFPEETEVVPNGKHIIDRLKIDVLEVLEALIQQYRHGRYFRDGLRMTIIGRPNVGKSSLLNCLIGKNRAIVTGTPGTTRDIIEETLNISGLPVVIVDTAGLQDTQEEVERIGIEKAMASIKDSDLILFMIDTSRPLSEEDQRIYEIIRENAHIVVQNKIDLLSQESEAVVPKEWGKSPAIAISALTGTHLGELKKKIQAIATGTQGILDESTIVPNARHQEMLCMAKAAVKRAIGELEKPGSAEIIAIDIKEALDNIHAVTGACYTEDLLDQIFSRFCIGK